MHGPTGADTGTGTPQTTGGGRAASGGLGCCLVVVLVVSPCPLSGGVACQVSMVRGNCPCVCFFLC